MLKLLGMRLRSSSSSFAISLLDLTVTTSSGLILQICLIMALSLRLHIALKVRLGQEPSFIGMERGTLHARAVYMATGLVREVAGCEKW